MEDALEPPPIPFAHTPDRLAIETVPALRVGYSHAILRELRLRGSMTLRQLLSSGDPEDLFKSAREHRAPEDRARDVLSFARRLTLLNKPGEELSLTALGRKYVDAMDPNDLWSVSDRQAELLRHALRHNYSVNPLLHGAALMLKLASTVAPNRRPSKEEWGLALAGAANMNGWQAARTFESQGARFLALLEDLELVDATGVITETARHVLRDLRLPPVPDFASAVQASRDRLGASPGREKVRVWIVRAGREGREEHIALGQGVACIGWSELGRLEPPVSRDELKRLVRESSGEEGEQSLAAQAGQIFRFIEEIRDEDLVVLPLLADPGHVAIGRIVGPYEHRTDGPFETSDARHTRPVEWLARSLSYDDFPADLQNAFGQQGTVSEISTPDAAERLLGVAATDPSPAVHLVLRWSLSQEPRTVDLHREIALKRGTVWWGKLGDPTSSRAGISARRLSEIRAQLEQDVPTFVFLHRTGEAWRARLRGIQTERPAEESELIPPYYREEVGKHHLWVKLESFEQLEEDYVQRHLVLDSDPRADLEFTGQSSLLYVRFKDESVRQHGRVWWVCQGASYQQERDLNCMWAPKLAKDGSRRTFWTNMAEVEVGDRVLHYANGQLRAVSTVTREAEDRSKPESIPGEYGADPGWFVRTDYTEFAEPLPLTDIPSDWRVSEAAEGGPFTTSGSVQQGYLYSLSERFVQLLTNRFPQLGFGSSGQAGVPYDAPSFATIATRIAEAGLDIEERTLRRYHLSLQTRGFVVLSGISGTGKTWLAEAYAKAVDADHLLVPVAPNWTTNEDLLGFLNPLSETYQHTQFSQFLKDAAAEYEAASREGRTAAPFHLTLDEMNLARVEYYFAKFLSGMEVRARNETAAIELAQGHEVLLTPNLYFTGTVNVDETTHGFADKVYDRAQLVELDAPRAALEIHLGSLPYASQLLAIWDAVHPVAPFAYRVLDEIRTYVQEAADLGVSTSEALDEQVLQKILPKLKGADLRIEGALRAFVERTDDFPLSRTKAEAMLESFEQHGFASYF